MLEQKKNKSESDAGAEQKNAWSMVIESIGTVGGNIVALIFIIVLLIPFLWQNNPEAWEALTFVVGVIGGIVRGSRIVSTKEREG